jgi:hypothetical protein
MYPNRAKRRIRVIPMRSIHCDALGYLFFLAMSGHAGPIQMDVGVTPVVCRISCGQAAALLKGRRARRTDLNVSSRAIDGNHGQTKSSDERCQPELCRGVGEYLRNYVFSLISVPCP